MSRLTDEQQLAVDRRRGSLLLAAGAGSGKTSVLVERFARAVCEDGEDPARILVVTFTERAAAELQRRVGECLDALGARSARARLQAGHIGTFHGFCARILRSHAPPGELPEVLDEGLAGRMRRRAFADALAQFLAGEPHDAVELIAAHGADRARATVLGTFATLRSRGAATPRLPAPSARAGAGGDPLAERALALWDELLQGFERLYTRAKRERRGVDFDDLELHALELLRRDADLRAALARQFALLMVDEAQDMSPRQVALLQAIERQNLFTVGDPWQSIYAFRHADVELFRRRQRELAANHQSLRLTSNFRARPELLEVVNAVFAERFGPPYTPPRAARPRSAAGAPLVELLLTDRRGWEDELGPSDGSGAAPWRAAEARQLALRVAELIESGAARAREVAVLLRGTADIDCYEHALRARGLATVASAGAFWERQEVADLIAYLRALADPLDELAFYGVLASPLADISAATLALLAGAASAAGLGLWELASALGGERAGAPAAGAEAELCAELELSAAERGRLERVCGWLARQRAAAPGVALAQLLAAAFEFAGLEARLLAQPEGERRLANARKLERMLEEWERSEGRDLAGFLEEAAFQQASGGFLASAEATAEPDAQAQAGVEEAVRLMSVHAAKGLEFEVVCVADLGRAPSAGVGDLLVDDERCGVRLIDLEDASTRAALDYEQLALERRCAQAAEEDRILYVAMTRARERLLLSGAADFAQWPADRPGAAPIAWLGPALVADLPARCRAAAAQGPADRALGDWLEPPLKVRATAVPLRCRMQLAAGPITARARPERARGSAAPTV